MSESNIISLKDLRDNMGKYIDLLEKGSDFLVLKKSRPVFKLVPPTDELWEEVIDFTKIKQGGVDIDDLLKRL